jgi:hypothetical protein
MRSPGLFRFARKRFGDAMFFNLMRFRDLADNETKKRDSLSVFNEGGAAIPVLARDYALNPRYLENGLDLPIFNPGVASFQNEIVFISRSSNLVCLGENRYVYAASPHNSINVFHRYDNDLNFLGWRTLEDAPLRKDAPGGIEDVRLFIWQGCLWGIGAGIGFAERGNLRARQVLVRFEDFSVADFTVLPCPGGHRLEKNWVPIVKDGNLYLIYSFDPMVVYEFHKGNLRLVKGEPTRKGDFPLRGGTPLMPWNGYHVGLVHAVQLKRKKYYLHAFVALDSNFDVVELSEFFYIQRPGIEFAAGLLEHKGDFLVSYGVADRVSSFCLLPFARIAPMMISLGSPSAKDGA